MRRDDNSSLTELVSVTPTQTSNTLHPSITPPPNFNLALTKGPLIFGEPSECHNASFINSLSKWIGNQTIEDNPCRKDDNAPCRAWTSVSLDVGSVQLFYFPPVTANVSYPSTVYMSHLDYTFTSPSVYMVWSTIRGYNHCSTTSIIRPIAVPGPDNSVITTSGWLTVPNDKYPVGPTLRSVIYPFDLTQGDSGVAGDTDGSKPNVGVSPNNMDHDLGGHTHTAGNGDNNGLAGGNGSPNSNNPTVSAVSVAVIGTEVISVIPGNTIGDSRDTTFSAPFRNDVLVPSLGVGAADQDPYVGTLVNSMINKGSPGQTEARVSTAGGQILFASPASTPSAGLGLENGAVSESGSSNGGSSSEGNLFRGAGTDNSTTSGSGALESGRCYAVIWGIIGILLFS
ncbi:hypothetical protein HYALB_00002690 [Hymenoscyphus albidus]|uniref:Uncharacterized protein n=1 Tax=Hymenoscyphus albidus TaxID=595503 RepID=A0A9N9LY68_9HELO|nr:hypothetical protein HYALB_00002690 [Hymenoscyphus albidus]